MVLGKETGQRGMGQYDMLIIIQKTKQNKTKAFKQVNRRLVVDFRKTSQPQLEEMNFGVSLGNGEH